MNVEIILRDDDGRRDERAAAESQMVEWARYAPPGAADAEFLRGLAAMFVGFDGDRLREAAHRLNALEQEIRHRDHAQLQSVAAWAEIHLLAATLITEDDSDTLGDLDRIREIAAEHKS